MNFTSSLSVNVTSNSIRYRVMHCIILISHFFSFFYLARRHIKLSDIIRSSLIYVESYNYWLTGVYRRLVAAVCCYFSHNEKLLIIRYHASLIKVILTLFNAIYMNIYLSPITFFFLDLRCYWWYCSFVHWLSVCVFISSSRDLTWLYGVPPMALLICSRNLLFLYVDYMYRN